MAGQQSGTAAPKQIPFPAGWSKMTAGAKRDWLAKNRSTPRTTALPKQPAPVSVTPALPGLTDDQEQLGDDQPQEETTLETPCPEQENDEVRLTIKLPGQDATSMTGRAFIANLLRGIADSLTDY